MKNYKSRAFRKELIILIMTIYIGAMLILGIAFTSISVKLFAEKAEEDIIFYLESIGDHLEFKMQFLEDIIIDIRHNNMLGDFFKGEKYNKNTINMQLANSSNLFSERNLVNSQFPFIQGIYIFNHNSDYESNYYYPITISEQAEKEYHYLELYKKFQSLNNQYLYENNREEVNLCLNLYDDNMKEMGVCIVSFNVNAFWSIFGDLDKYKDSFWSIEQLDGISLMKSKNAFQSDKQDIYTGIERTFEQNINGENYLLNKREYGLSLKTVVAVKKSAAYLSMKPTVITFAVIFIVLLVGIAFVVFFVTYRFARPVKIIAENIRSFGEGGLQTRLQGFNTQEFNEISVVFNEMAERINDLILQNYEKKLIATQSQVRFLQSQINPHFMFNILAMISMRAKLKGNDDVADLLNAFSKLIQGKIFRKDIIKIPLYEEMELVEFYLYLQSNRFRDKITYHINYGCLSLKENKIPRLCIEPIVENAVSHGLEQKEGKGKIQIDIYEDKGKMYIYVEDDGIGFDLEEIKKVQKKADENHVHIGIANTNELIHILYGEEYGIQIDSEPGKGTKVLITLPIEKGGNTSVESNDC